MRFVCLATIINCFKHCCSTHIDTDLTSTTDSTFKESDITKDFQGIECDSPIEDFKEEYVHVDDDVEVAEIASMVKERANDSIGEQADECDEEIWRPTKPQLKSAIQLIQRHLHRSDGGDKHLPKLDDIECSLINLFA